MRNVEQRTKKTLERDALLARAETNKGTAYLKVVAPTRGFRVRFDAETGKEYNVQNTKTMLWFFTPNTSTENDAYQVARVWAQRKPKAVFSVSVKCSGVCRDIPVIGEPMVVGAFVEEDHEAA
jgi:hypothetical protein